MRYFIVIYLPINYCIFSYLPMDFLLSFIKPTVLLFSVIFRYKRRRGNFSYIKHILYLQLTDMYDVMELEYRCDRLLWYRPVTMGRLLELKHQYPHAKLVIGNTEVGM